MTAMFQTVDKVPAKAGLFYVYDRFFGIIQISEDGVFYDDKKFR